ncbi:alpha/beta-hydrolase [Gonapodya prolifera JEL478]|uniref:Alpha/beta-hydrolase n=1 Tax=Gonapodya prolifera (strain JEL478) TaxID=1344416 RepID=A0A139AQM7_GONPJ|nr:alpha/beta-hydrolase [Gonapodya prolifera JEL478]|eukprot:KXS19022.1 alpha/beta-hydrolase [Gonapodya prolifera JEL478]
MTVDSTQPVQGALAALRKAAAERGGDENKILVPPSWEKVHEETFGLYRGAVGSVYNTAFAAMSPKDRLLAFRQALAAAPSPPLNPAVKFTPFTIPRSSVEGLSEATSAGDTVAVEWVETSADEGKEKDVVIYIHGGAMTISNPETYRTTTQEIALGGFKVLAVDYHLSPEVQFPSALIDCVNVYNWLLNDQKVSSSHIAVTGDSAGGNLTIALAYYIRDHNLPAPAGYAPLTPWCDFSISAPSCNSTNPVFNACMLARNKGGPQEWLGESAVSYMGDAKQALENSNIIVLLDSVNADKHLPPLFLSTGTVDRLLSEVLAFYIKRVQGGEVAHLYVSEDGPHDFHFAFGTAASNQFLKALNQFFRDAFAKAPSASKSSFSFVSAGPKKDFTVESKLSVDDAKAYLKGIIEVVKEEGTVTKYGLEHVYAELSA